MTFTIRVNGRKLIVNAPDSKAAISKAVAQYLAGASVAETAISVQILSSDNIHFPRISNISTADDPTTLREIY